MQSAKTIVGVWVVTTGPILAQEKKKEESIMSFRLEEFKEELQKLENSSLDLVNLAAFRSISVRQRIFQIARLIRETQKCLKSEEEAIKAVGD